MAPQNQNMTKSLKIFLEHCAKASAPPNKHLRGGARMFSTHTSDWLVEQSAYLKVLNSIHTQPLISTPTSNFGVVNLSI